MVQMFIIPLLTHLSLLQLLNVCRDKLDELLNICFFIQEISQQVHLYGAHNFFGGAGVLAIKLRASHMHRPVAVFLYPLPPPNLFFCKRLER